MKNNGLMPTLALGLFLPGGGALAQQVNPADNPLIGAWVLSEPGYGGCYRRRTFAEGTQTWSVDGKVVEAPATYAVSGNTVYVQQHIGSGGTTAFVVVSRNEIKDTLGTNACHWTRE